MKAALYARVSTDMQSEGYSIDAQKELLAAYCKLKGIREYEYYVDPGFSGSSTHRPMMEKMISDCKERLVDIVIVYKLDRLSRSQKDTLYLIEEIFIPNGVDFVSISENFDTSTPFGKAMIGILSVFAQLERETIRERTRMGMRERVKAGYYPGGGRLPMGYDYDSERGILVPNERAGMVAEIYDMYISGASAQSIADYFGLKYDKLVTQIIRGKVNYGAIVYQGVEYPGRHEGIVTKEIYEQANRIMQSRSKNNIRSGSNLLTGLIYCGVCGAKMRYQKWGKAGHKICCYSQQSDKAYMIKDPNCDNLKHSAADIERAVLSEIFKFSLDPSRLREYSEQSGTRRIEMLKNQIAANTRRINNLLGFISEGIAVEETKAKLQSLKAENARMETSLAEDTKKEEKLESFRRSITNLDKIWGELDQDAKRAILLALVSRIVITRDKVDIYYTFE